MAAYRDFGGRSKYARKAYSYVNSHGKTVHVPARPGLAPPTRKSRAKSPTGARRSAVPAPTAHRSKGGARYRVRVANPILIPGAQFRPSSVRNAKRRLTEKNAARNTVKRVARRQVRRAIPGFRPVRVTRRRKRR